MDPKAFICAVQSAWQVRARTPSGKQLTLNHVRVAAKLAFWRHGTAPRHRALARASRQSVSTVRRALRILHELEFLTWTRRVLACNGWRAQISNAYDLSYKKIGYQRLISSAKLNTSVRPSAPMGELLLARRVEMERRMRERLAA